MSRLANRTARLREIEELLLLTPEGLSVQQMADRLKVDRRTIYRDMSFLEEQEVPVWQTNGRYGINRTRYQTTFHFSYQESIALVLAGLLLSRTIDERNPHVISALRKLAVSLPQTLTNHLQRAAKRVLTNSEARGQLAVLEAVAEGWGASRKVQIHYRSPRSGSLRKRIMAPYALEPTPSGIYVIGFDDWANDLRTFKLDRLEQAEVLPISFVIPEHFDLEAHLATCWSIMAGDKLIEVVLRFTPSITSRVRERRWHSSQKLQLTPEGGCILRIYVAEPREMQPWIRSWGAQVEVLEPKWLREQIAAELRQAVAQYR
ncbi:MAG: transcriptional regulator [Chloroflexota bacterium]